MREMHADLVRAAGVQLALDLRALRALARARDSRCAASRPLVFSTAIFWRCTRCRPIASRRLPERAPEGAPAQRAIKLPHLASRQRPRRASRARRRSSRSGSRRSCPGRAGGQGPAARSRRARPAGRRDGGPARSPAFRCDAPAAGCTTSPGCLFSARSASSS